EEGSTFDPPPRSPARAHLSSDRRRRCLSAAAGMAAGALAQNEGWRVRVSTPVVVERCIGRELCVRLYADATALVSLEQSRRLPRCKPCDDGDWCAGRLRSVSRAIPPAGSDGNRAVARADGLAD